jgi:hypothetical protein
LKMENWSSLWKATAPTSIVTDAATSVSEGCCFIKSRKLLVVMMQIATGSVRRVIRRREIGIFLSPLDKQWLGFWCLVTTFAKEELVD